MKSTFLSLSKAYRQSNQEREYPPTRQIEWWSTTTSLPPSTFFLPPVLFSPTISIFNLCHWNLIYVALINHRYNKKMTSFLQHSFTFCKIINMINISPISKLDIKVSLIFSLTIINAPSDFKLEVFNASHERT